ncbi:bifunctional 3,4-dihydroxy-2-butanone-4-phosphate synthase/GTP cyclohydrolase II [Rummeliibacillus stabekisii]|uniref:bifunctional 3,4-dihydroxy-2-butanone-4-phosphate synthase/GTP cyclohydrolase II n=1 Tax=Rummeliibacillus stabekisii TaxID=241244 RepID=UPI00116E50B7|nr:bifunctional 3,4-dihydroxy-2-butanone-4-phosphate synthase/GTP cyclohydrolase II [Rummeliibacillus stabekisii]MBB5171393.1 3,4-dihydroxy 2-butanone 4-phosphate synthase/GTP cyclohydrolase II [Rummeliibacillus stabekisii]GEL05700.1 riboflavin biosynthesis protein RibBA [Rummeliibacillus stabekisii]
MFHSIEEAIQDLKKGKMIIVVDDENRENEGDLLVLAEYATPENINFMATYGRGLICTPVSQELAEHLELYPMVHNNTDNHQTAFTVSIDYKDTTTGISAFERSETIMQLLNKDAGEADFRRPGHVFPLIAKENGVLERQGHTEAAIDFARICGSEPAAVICEIMSDNGEMSRVPELLVLAEKYDLKIVTIADLIRYRYIHEKLAKREASVKMPTTLGEFQMVGYSNKIDSKEHIALVKGELREEDAPLVRIHSECLTGDVFHSKRCDCGPQLEKAIEKIEAAGTGVILYMHQEGRGIGLLNKLKAYELQEQGLDTVEANEQLGFPAEMRDYGLCAQMLRDLGVTRVRLMTNNPEKVEGLRKYGIEIVERVALETEAVAENQYYLQTKKIKMNHILA